MNDRLNKKALSEELRKLAASPHTIDDEGNPVSKEAVLAKLVWQAALGYSEKIRNEKGQMIDRVHNPASWAMQYLYERLEGKVAAAEVEEPSRIRASDKVRDLVKNRLNKEAAKILI